MFFFLIGAPMVFVVGLLTGIGACLSICLLLVSYASGIPVTSPMHMGVAVYLILGKAWHRLTSSSPRLTRKQIHSSLDMEKLNTLPYVRVLPMTTPSKETQFWDSLLIKQKEGFYLKEINKPYSPSRVSMLRWSVWLSEPMFTLYDRSVCRVSRSSIVGSDKNDIGLYWVQYEGASMSSGVVLCLHGGGYVAGMPKMQYSLCAELSKLTGAVCVSVDYRLPPDNGAIITDALSDAFAVYRHLIENENVPSSQICITGESAGGGLSLLLLQKIRDDDSVGDPACCWVNSPWTDLSMDSASVSRNEDADGILVNDPKRYFQRIAVGEIDINLEKRYGRDEDKPSLTDARFSPLFGDWAGLCPIYFMVGATEMLLDDTLRAAKKAHEAGTDVAVDIAPFMTHTWPMFLRTVPEAKYAVVRGSDFILKQFKAANVKVQKAM